MSVAFQHGSPKFAPPPPPRKNLAIIYNWQTLVFTNGATIGVSYLRWTSNYICIFTFLNDAF
jgi:hypothetical protein